MARRGSSNGEVNSRHRRLICTAYIPLEVLKGVTFVSLGILCEKLTVHLARPNELCTPRKDFMYSFGIGDMQMYVARGYMRPYRPVRNVRISLVAEVPSLGQIVEERGQLK